MEGSLSYDNFIIGCRNIVEKSNVIGDDWQLKTSRLDHRVQYLVKKENGIYKSETDVNSITDESNTLNDFSSEDDIEDRDSACKEICCNNSEHISFEYHVIYNMSYSVPVMYFYASRLDGKSLLLEDIWKMVPKLHENALQDKWSFITQIDHPILGHPVFHIHPCNTNTMMRNLVSEPHSDSYRYLLMWLSALGPLVGLKLADGFFMDNQM